MYHLFSFKTFISFSVLFRFPLRFPFRDKWHPVKLYPDNQNNWIFKHIYSFRTLIYFRETVGKYVTKPKTMELWFTMEETMVLWKNLTYFLCVFLSCINVRNIKFLLGDFVYYVLIKCWICLFQKFSSKIMLVQSTF